MQDLRDAGRGRAAYERWRAEALSPTLFDVDARLDGFHNTVRRTRLGPTWLVDYEASPADYTRTAERARRDGVDGVWLQLVSTGAVDAVAPAGDLRVGPGMWGLCDLSRFTRQHTHEGTGRIIVLPREAFGGRLPEDAHGRTASGARRAILDDYFTWLTEAEEPPGGADARVTMEAMAAVVLACFGAGPHPPEEAAPALRTVALRRAVAFIDAHLAAEVGVDAVAQAAGVSRATLYRLAAPWGGVDALIWERRLEAVRHALSDPARPGRTGSIAETFGFKSHAHFSSRFKARFGFSPRNLRPF